MNLEARKYPEAPRPQDLRTPYQHDRDRILHSTAFRKLQYKTQVYAIHEGDLYRTRMTHSLEVAQIARGLAQQLGGNLDLAEAIALAHDLGHTPFGHSGTEELNALLKKYRMRFEHNVQSFRIVTSLEQRYTGFPGLNLTAGTLQGIIRHETFFDNPADTLKRLPREMKKEIQWLLEDPLTLEARIVNLADAIAYASHDIEDALTVGLISWERFRDELERKHVVFMLDIMREVEGEIGRYRADNPKSGKETAEVLRSRRLAYAIIDRLIREAVEQAGKSAGGIGLPIEMEKQVRVLVEEILIDEVYHDHRVELMTLKGRKIIRHLFETYMECPQALPPIVQESTPGFFNISANQRKSQKGRRRLAQAVTDYISGMTDKYAMDLYQVMSQAYEKTL
jgi:dGTPase